MPVIDDFTPAAFEVQVDSLWIASLPGRWEEEVLNWKLNSLLSLLSTRLDFY
jgi:hypothetical protein